MAFGRPGSAARAFRNGADALGAEDFDKARTHFQVALERDAGCADALLGLHALQAAPDDCIERLAANADRLGELQEGPRMFSWYYPLGFDMVRLTGSDDARLAYARELVSTEPDAAEQLCAQCSPDNPLVEGMRARIAFTRGDYHATVARAQKLTALDQVAGDVNLLLGMAYVRQDLFDLAFTAFERSAAQARTRAGRLAAMYNFGDALEACGRDDEARRMYASIYAEDADYADVADRLETRPGAPEPQPAVVPAPPPVPALVVPQAPASEPAAPADDGWDDLVGQLD